MTELGERARKAADDVIAARPPFATAVSAALAPHRRTAAQQAAEATLVLSSQLDVLAEIDRELIGAGGSPGRPPLPGHRTVLGTLLGRLHGLAETEI